ncbi:hypothetical protein DFR70_10251 [Nocardia tenerifensis]|uniref:Uncharacterized protein n=1 Tax=Nocardia tenerifensis TaxID=228006 RepID=A0A318KUD8_9NOCA|nr:DUF6247 family protein [Nocardia tenerifensis]PXX68371.1 hypothetical protein DFR70_10251 [Nocardia tenerifensis]
MSAAYGVVPEALPDAVPWVAFLPAADVDEFLTEFVAVAQKAVALGNLSPLTSLLTQWRNTAEIHADPVLLALVTREPEGDFGPVPIRDLDECDR